MKKCKQCGQECNDDFCENCNTTFSTATKGLDEVKEIEKYKDFIDYQPVDSINDTLVLLRLLREIYADKIKSADESRVLNSFSEKCQLDKEEVAYHEDTIKDEMGVISYNHDIPVELFWDIERLCSIESSSLFRVWVKNRTQSTFNRVSVNFIIDSDDIQILSPAAEITLDIEQTHCYTSSYKVSSDYPGGEISFHIEVILFDHHGHKWIYHSQDKLILKFPENRNRQTNTVSTNENTAFEAEDNDNSAFQRMADFDGNRHYDLREVNQGVTNAVNIPLMLINAISESVLKLQQMSDAYNAVYNIGININSTSGSLKKVELVSYPFFTMGLAKNGIPELSDFGIEAKSGISRLHLSFCYEDEGLKLKVLNTEGTVLNGVQIKDNNWQAVSHGDNIGLFGDIELRIKISTEADRPDKGISTKVCDKFSEKLNTIIDLMTELKKKVEKRKRERVLKLLNREYNEFLYMQSRLKSNDKHLNYIELYHTENSLIDNIKYFFLLDNITIGSDIMEDDLYISALAPSQVKLSFSKGKFYLTQLDGMTQSAILRGSKIITLERYYPEVMEINDVIQMGSEVTLNLYEI